MALDSLFVHVDVKWECGLTYHSAREVWECDADSVGGVLERNATVVHTSTPTLAHSAIKDAQTTHSWHPHIAYHTAHQRTFDRICLFRVTCFNAIAQFSILKVFSVKILGDFLTYC